MEPTDADGPDDVRTLDDVQALAALGNPTRFRLMDALAVSGPATTSALARMLGVATGSVSHHVRVLREAGLVRAAEQAGADRRERRWELVTRGMRWDAERLRRSPAAATAGIAADRAMLARQFEHAAAWLASPEPPWDEAAFAGHYWLTLSPEELAELTGQINELLLAWRRRRLPDDGAERRTVLAFLRAFPAEP